MVSGKPVYMGLTRMAHHKGIDLDNSPLKNKFKQRIWPMALAACLTLSTSQAQNTGLPALGDGVGISLSAERQLGDRIARELYRDPDFLEDPVLDEYIQLLWAPLIKAAAARGELTPELEERFAWRILLGRDRSVNAFALPGGYLGVHLGLIAVVGSHDELASVLAHELSHVSQRHIARGISDQSKMAPWVIASMILGALAVSKSAQGAQALIVGGQAAAVQSQLSYSRDMEREADRVGYGILTDAGYDPRGFVGMFGKLQQAAGLNDSGAYPYLRSHPLTTERMADMQARQQLLTHSAPLGGSMAQSMLAARARVLSQPQADALKARTQEAEQPRSQDTPAHRVGALYGATLAHLLLNNLADSQRTLQTLLQSVHLNGLPSPDHSNASAAIDQSAMRWVRLLQAEVAYAQGQFQSSLNLLAASAATQDLQRPELIAASQALLRLPGHPMQAHITRQLRQRVQRAPHDGQAWDHLSRQLTQQGQALAALRAEGEAQVARLDWSGAVDRFRAAQDMAKQARMQAGDHIEASIVDVRLRFAQARLQELNAPSSSTR
jgi:predicted Zn-dependent protease